MKRLILTACAGLLAAAVATPSFAADMPRAAYKSPLQAAPFTWSGFYVGINGGYGWGKSDFSNIAGTGSIKPNGALLGGTIGYNMQSGALVFGLEGDFDASWMKGSDNTAGTLCAGAIACEGKNSWFATARGRLGYSFDRWLPFITGGAAFADEKITATTGLSETKSRAGWTAGAGLEYAFLGPYSVKIEYLYADFGKSTCSVTTCGLATDVSFKTNIVRAGLNYRF